VVDKSGQWWAQAETIKEVDPTKAKLFTGFFEYKLVTVGVVKNMSGERGRGIRGQGYRGGRGRGELGGVRRVRERSPSFCRRGRDDVGYAGRGWVGEGRTSDENVQGEAKLNVDEVFKGIKNVMDERVESVVGSTREEVKEVVRKGMMVLVDSVKELMCQFIGKVECVEEKMAENERQVKLERMDMEKRTTELLVGVEENVQEVRTQMCMGRNERRSVELMTQERIDEVEEKVKEVKEEVGKERCVRRDAEILTQERLADVEDMVQEIRAEVDKLAVLRNKARLEESVKEMERKVKLAECKVKVGNVNIGLETDCKATIVKRVLGEVRNRAKMEDLVELNRVLKRTRLVVLSRKSERRQELGRTVYTVPMLFECQDRSDAQKLESMLRHAGYFPCFHWPNETMEFIGKLRDRVQVMDNRGRYSFVRIRPEEREGCIMLRADTRTKLGERFVTKGVWRCPPLNRMLWESVEGLFTPYIRGGGLQDRD